METPSAIRRRNSKNIQLVLGEIFKQADEDAGGSLIV
jgi:hypothetical protein